MKVNLYMDVYHGWRPEYAVACAGPAQKADGNHRMMITVDVPDHFVFGVVDARLPVIATIEVDKE